jgi:hypothetical protein
MSTDSASKENELQQPVSLITAANANASLIRPSLQLANYVQMLVSDELRKRYRTPRDILERYLWAAAQYDYFVGSGAIVSMIDGLGLPRTEYHAYQRLIDQQLKRLDNE